MSSDYNQDKLTDDVIAALAQHGHGAFQTLPRTIGGRYGLSSKEFTPAMAKAVFDELSATVPRSPFTIGIHDDVTHLSLDFDPHWKSGAAAGVTACVFYGLGSDGTVSANKNSVQIIAAHTGRHAQGYFVYDSKKSGAMTVSHLRFGPGPIRSAYLIGAGEADFVACHQPAFLTRPELLAHAKPGATLLLNTPLAPGRLWASLPPLVRATIRGRNLRLYAIDAYALAAAQRMGRRINTVMQTAFFAISGVLPADTAIAALKRSVEDSYGRKGRRLVEQNHAAIDATLAALHAIPVPERDEAADDGAGEAVHAPIPADAPAFVRLVTAELLAGRGNELPVSEAILYPDANPAEAEQHFTAYAKAIAALSFCDGGVPIFGRRWESRRPPTPNGARAVPTLQPPAARGRTPSIRQRRQTR